MLKLLFASDEPAIVPADEVTLASASPCSTTSAASPHIHADWATASTLIETSDCLDPTDKPEPMRTQPSGHEPAVVDKDTAAHHEKHNSEDDQLDNAEVQTAVDGTQTPVIPEQTAGEQLAEELSAMKTENEQLRAQLDKIHAILTGQVKLMNDAVQNNRAKSQEPSSSWGLGALQPRGSSCDLGQQVTDAVSRAFAAPETKLGWLTRTAMTIAGVYMVSRYGKDPALRIVYSTKGAVEAAGTAVGNQFSEMRLSVGGASEATRQGLHC